MPRHIPLACLALLAGLICCGTAEARVLVLHSDVNAYKPGQELGDEVVIAVPERRTVRVLLTNDKTKELKGPVSVRVGEIEPTGATSLSLWNLVRKFFEGHKPDETQPGGVRDGAKRVPVRFGWDAVPANAEGPVCVAAGRPLMLRRPKGDAGAEATLFDLSGGAKTRLAWTAGSDDTAWPATLPPQDGGRYTLAIDGGDNIARFSVTLVGADAIATENTPLTLYKLGCTAQLADWLGLPAS